MVKVACICEGAAEQAIMELLLENDCLIFKIEDLLEEEVIRCRKAANFQRKYLNKPMDEKVIVYRIIDSKKENFKLTGPYKQKVKEVIDVITAPEIEMLIIHAEGLYDRFSRSKLKPSEFISRQLNGENVKSASFVKAYFADIEKLKQAIKTHHAKIHADDKERSIYQLIIKK